MTILENEVVLVCAPGKDGITNQIIIFLRIEFPNIYVDYLNYTRNVGHYGVIPNPGIMVIKNKKSQSN